MGKYLVLCIMLAVLVAGALATYHGPSISDLTTLGPTVPRPNEAVVRSDLARWRPFSHLIMTYVPDFFGDGSEVAMVTETDHARFLPVRNTYLVWPDGRIERCAGLCSYDERRKEVVNEPWPHFKKWIRTLVWQGRELVDLARKAHI